MYNALLQLTLQEFGADVKVAASSREALEILRDFKADVLVSHIGMPEEDGNVFIDRVRHLRPGGGRNNARYWRHRPYQRCSPLARPLGRLSDASAQALGSGGSRKANCPARLPVPKNTGW
jgi:hypothetical protein